mmetsp:Transcript_590/g.854  ORF Transcript_590/g.854 Transcript_590/m.854 type:complete len:123 (-) Transcript_590:123-491(-)|eukprot:CAMPEP_0184512994 /NCGR_PEP_ID=MMETSP0198_2-20121128/3186_1 /TAXON_ID=1112570 /ORGANISM="Thraustochytrium sp., Strain LLF1b" /LENGTH=122 /DNA_ID=CAMNT_0026903073 /DNA_START=84 /DNA_END=452 /DNA_ORIENTATION=-
MAAAQQANEVDEVVKSLTSVENVSRYVIFNKDGIVLRHEGWPSESGDQGYRKCVQLAATVAPLVHHCSKGCQDLLPPPNNDVECLRLKTKNYEMIVSPGSNYTVVAIQENYKTGKEGSAGGN